MGRAPNWKPEEIEYIEENWGKTSLKRMSQRLGRSEAAIKLKVGRKLHLGAFLDAGDYVTYNQLAKALGKYSANTYTLISWVKNRGFPIKYKTVGNNKFRVVYLNDFWKWAEQNRDFIDFSRLDENILGAEPAWVKTQRRSDQTRSEKYLSSPWTPTEDKELLRLLRQYRYTYLDLSKRLHRTSGAIQRRISELRYRERPIKADNTVKWTTDEYTLLAGLIKSGVPAPLIAEQIGKSEKAVRGRVYQTYKTENLDAVRRMIGFGDWGDGKPIPLVRQEFRKADTKHQLERLTRALLMHRNQLCFDGYWQKNMCVRWDDVKGCTAGESDCDSCVSFQRIKPQYCRRCGATIWAREEKHICDRCTAARKKQAQRKFAILHSRGMRSEQEENPAC